MPEVFVAKVAEFPDGDRRIIQHGAHDIGVFHWEGQFYAYANLCLHQGGPACEGLIMHQVENVIGPDKTLVGQKFSDTQVNFVCPWHGYEYDIKTGECAADRRLRLKKLQRRPARRRHLRRDLTKGTMIMVELPLSNIAA